MIYSEKASVWEFSILDLSKNSFWYKGVLLKGKHDSRLKKSNALRNAISVLKSYFFNVYAHQNISIKVGLKTITTKTDAFGRFQVISEIGPDTDTVVTITLSGGDLPLKIVQDYPIHFQEEQRTLDIISDIDDTILESNTANIYKRIKTLLFLVPEKRTVITFTKNIYQAWQDVNPRLFYVSKSESNLTILLTTFIKHNNLPCGMLFLTPYLSFFQLIKGLKPTDFKLNTIRFLIVNSRSSNYVLFGDDSQKDMSIYATLAKEYPDLILKIYIRQTGESINNKQQVMWENLNATGVSASYFLPEHAESILNEIEVLKQQLK
ncbi:App1 family protein [Formosa sp. PL04]|uniref:App1 family protein n=1 Tax=Formosa sp. PL04 TaxID=3081755 RepID=UPI002980EFA0|nr:App1 family protein [Formosa sp. PL04]MDW5290378.1 App1 family protein [Formosa sp. PL04]